MQLLQLCKRLSSSYSRLPIRITNRVLNELRQLLHNELGFKSYLKNLHCKKKLTIFGTATKDFLKSSSVIAHCAAGAQLELLYLDSDIPAGALNELLAKSLDLPPEPPDEGDGRDSGEGVDIKGAGESDGAVLGGVDSRAEEVNEVVEAEG
ncbi:hypothetical protein GCK72_009008 [Caenorhabditis remanei]|uniref:Uncharacterized protein n=1 Tax=Caenorhabditis remanei TaxID=31234 RepID=A0A6A5GZ37_CAERE|nr:hypothetical protein GCK72_009008 [Caenorhabditis remanei]KAF1760758.1 hypothetical protein GCK72_009008 [Caenorhabditis remanei]